MSQETVRWAITLIKLSKAILVHLELGRDAQNARKNSDKEINSRGNEVLVGPDLQRPEPQHVAQNASQALARQKDADILARKLSVLPVYASLDQTGKPACDQKCHEAAPEANVVANVRQKRYKA